jgi:type I restriction enzyme S subunit
MTGVQHPRVHYKDLAKFSIPLPPLNEQRRIVEKIEALTARSRKARAALDEIPALLDQFRQSVLAAAFRGDLTADWRTQNPDVEPAEALDLL